MMGFGDLLSMFGGSSGMNMPVDFGQMAPQQAPGLGSADFSAMPQMSNPSASPFSMIGNALSQGGNFHSSGSTLNAIPPPPSSGLLQQLLASLARR